MQLENTVAILVIAPMLFFPSVNNHFNKDRHLESRTNFKLYRAAALAEWRQLAT